MTKLAEMEEAAVHRVIETGILGGVPLDVVYEKSRHIDFQPGCLPVLQGVFG